MILKYFRRRRPTISTHKPPTVEDMLTAYAWNLTLTEWYALTDFERKECRRLVTTAPKFEVTA